MSTRTSGGTVRNRGAVSGAQLPDGDVKSFLDSLYNDATYSDTHGRNTGFNMSRNEVNQLYLDYLGTLDERSWQEEMYNKYESPAAMIQQYKDAGLNPALMYGDSGAGVSSMSSNSSNPDFSSVAGARTDSPMAVMSQVLSALGGVTSLGSQVANTVADVRLKGANVDVAESQAELNRATARNTDLRSEEQETINLYADARERLKNDKTRSDIDHTVQSIRESVSRIGVNNSVIDVNGTQIDLNRQYLTESESRVALNESQCILNGLNAEKIDKLLPFVQQREVQELNLMYSQEELNDEDRQLRMWQAQWELLQAMKEMDLVDADYYNEMADLNKELTTENIKTEKTQRKIAVADCIVGNTCDVVNTAVGAATGLGGLNVSRSRAKFENYRDMQSGAYFRSKTPYNYQAQGVRYGVY